MGSFFKSGWNLGTCIEETRSNFHLIEYADVTAQQKSDPFGMIHAVYLYTSHAKPKLTAWQPKRGNLPMQKKSYADYNRFHAFGIPGTPHVVLVFTQNEKDSRHLLQFASEIHPGRQVLIVRPRFESSIAQNIVVRTNEPLLPIEATKMSNCPPPVNVTQESFVFFKFETRKVDLLSATCIDSVCAGSLCDGQNGSSSCACTIAPAKKHWAINFAFDCPELHDVSNGEVSITSNALTELFVSKEVRYWPLSDERIHPMDLHRSVSFFYSGLLS